ncbi:xylulose kinase-like [Sycon ciliatum]|uniref:xylulose kinase-like n=1 Tax=Sycon ciliatum TaxID=27933 RepID=UPI0020A8F0AC|eukprot:scpid41026/ scgid28356/ Xylulose kinase
MADLESKSDLFLGLDFSTQRAKAIILDGNRTHVAASSVTFGEEPSLVAKYPQCSPSGYEEDEQSGQVTSPTLMWVESLDILFSRLVSGGVDLGRVVAISVSGQQHGSVYWKTGAEKVLNALDSKKGMLHEQLQGAFAVQDSPIWKDTSTGKQCKELEVYTQGPRRLAEVTGSRAYHRFTGNQIAKISQTQPENYEQCERISLVSSFVCCLLTGAYAPIDYSDGSGMNLLDIRPCGGPNEPDKRVWMEAALEYCGKDLAEKLGTPVPSHTVLPKPISPYFSRYGFRPTCSIVAATGDNPSSLAALYIREGDVGISLGSSDTVFVWLPEAKPGLFGHVFVNPVDTGAYMGLLCYSNGDMTRKKVRDSTQNLQRLSEEEEEQRWQAFTHCLQSTPPANNGNVGVYFFEEEIVPHAKCTVRLNAAGEKVDSFADQATEVRALIEGQIMAKRIHSEQLGYKCGPGTRVLATGGGSKNPEILKVMANVFNTDVYIFSESESAAVGAAYRALHGYERAKALAAGDTDTDVSYHSLISEIPGTLSKVCSPDGDAAALYGQLMRRYEEIEDMYAM